VTDSASNSIKTLIDAKIDPWSRGQMLDSLPSFAFSRVFQIVQSANLCLKNLRTEGKTDLAKFLAASSVSIGTPPVTQEMHRLIEAIVLGAGMATIRARCKITRDNGALDEFLLQVDQLIASSLHYAKASEESDFMVQARNFSNMTALEDFHCLVLTESPARVAYLIERYLSKDAGSEIDLSKTSNARNDGIVDGASVQDRSLSVHRIDAGFQVTISTLEEIETHSHKLCVVQVERLPTLSDLSQAIYGDRWHQVIGRVVFIESSDVAHKTHCTFVMSYLAPVVATLKKVQTCVAGRPANTQLHLRQLVEMFCTNTELATDRMLKKYTVADLKEIRKTIETHVPEADGIIKLTYLVESVVRDSRERVDEYLAYGESLIASKWMSYFYPGLKVGPKVVGGGGRAALVLVGEYHKDCLRQACTAYLQSKAWASENSVLSTLAPDCARQLRETAFIKPTLILPTLAWTYGDVFPTDGFSHDPEWKLPETADLEFDIGLLSKKLEEKQQRFASAPGYFNLWTKSMLIVVNSPLNPTGVVYSSATRQALLAISAQYGIAIVDDNSYHRLIHQSVGAEIETECMSMAQLKNRSEAYSSAIVHTAGATTKGMQGSGDRTGIVFSTESAFQDFAKRSNQYPHLMSLFFTERKLDHGLRMAQVANGQLVPSANQWQALGEQFVEVTASRSQDCRPELRSPTYAKSLDICQVLLADVRKRILAAKRAIAHFPEVSLTNARGAFYICIRLPGFKSHMDVHAFLQELARQRKVDFTYAGGPYVRASLGGDLVGDDASYRRLEAVL